MSCTFLKVKFCVSHYYIKTSILNLYVQISVYPNAYTVGACSYINWFMLLPSGNPIMADNTQRQLKHNCLCLVRIWK